MKGIIPICSNSKASGERRGPGFCSAWWRERAKQHHCGRWKLPPAAHWRPSIHKCQVGLHIEACVSKKCRRALYHPGRVHSCWWLFWEMKGKKVRLNLCYILWQESDERREGGRSGRGVGTAVQGAPATLLTD